MLFIFNVKEKRKDRFITVMNETSNNNRIVKNTIFLYFRMFFTSILSLYTARVVLQTLGIEDFGIYNVVGGVVTFMGFVTATMSSATQRYLSYNLGKQDSLAYRRTFSMLINVYLIFCVLALLILEIVGPIYIKKYMTLDANRICATQVVFQFTLLTFLVNTLSIPFKSSVIAYEKMGVYAYIGIIESVLHLLLAIVVSSSHVDHLILYGGLYGLMQVLITLFLLFYCRFKLEDCKFIRYWSNDYFKELASYAGWNLFGSITGVLNLQGQAIVLNLFFGPIVNAAKAIGDRVNGMISQFASNFYMAVTPQIIKSYASGDVEYMRKLVLSSSRYSFFMLFIVVAPLFVVIEPLLNLWLGSEQVNLEMIRFCQCTLIYMLVNVLEQPLTMTVRATGKIKKYQVLVGLVTLTFIPFSVLMFYCGAPAYFSVILLSIIYAIAHILRMRIACPILKTNMANYSIRVLVPVVLVVAVTVVSILLISRFVCDKHWMINIFTVILITLLITVSIGITNSERTILKKIIINKIRISNK